MESREALLKKMTKNNETLDTIYSNTDTNSQGISYSYCLLFKQPTLITLYFEAFLTETEF